MTCGTLKSNLKASKQKEDTTRMQLDAEIKNYGAALKDYCNKVSTFGGLAAENRIALGDVLESLMKGLGYLSFSLGNVSGQITAFKKEFQVDSPVVCLRLVDFLAPLLECSAVSQVRITQDVTFLKRGEFSTDLNILNTILERRPENLDQTIPMIANTAFDKIEILEGKMSNVVETIEVPSPERKIRKRF